MGLILTKDRQYDTWVTGGMVVWCPRQEARSEALAQEARAAALEADAERAAEQAAAYREAYETNRQ